MWLAYQEGHLAGNYRLSLKIEGLSCNSKVLTVKNPYELVREAKQQMKTQPSQHPDCSLVKLWAEDPVKPGPDFWPTETVR